VDRFRPLCRLDLFAPGQCLGRAHKNFLSSTDNMTLSGETIDDGPCAFMEACDPATVFNSIDHGGRYA
jgi:uncharacterized protein YdiU (UPF0061 family)